MQVTVFVCRMTGTGNNYWDRNPLDPLVPSDGELWSSGWPVPVCVGVSATGNLTELSINDAGDDNGDNIYEESFINDGCTIVDNATGRIYRVLERYSDSPGVILLDGPWQGSTLPPMSVWVIPPPEGGGREPCIEVYQRLMQF